MSAAFFNCKTDTADRSDMDLKQITSYKNGVSIGLIPYIF